MENNKLPTLEDIMLWFSPDNEKENGKLKRKFSEWGNEEILIDCFLIKDFCEYWHAKNK